ncbi:cytochrome P450 [archaeon]|nr:MAG: cytochrome P450 [archaeon]
MVAYLPYAMGRLDSLWPNPTHFDPTRFLGVKHSSFKFIAFNAGLRICLGQHLAMTEASFVLAILFRRYKVTPVPGQDVQPTESLTLPMERGLMARITLRD